MRWRVYKFTEGRFGEFVDKEENNIQSANINNVELKITRKESDSLVTLFCKEPPNKNISNKELIQKFGYEYKKKEKILKLDWN